MNLVIHEARFGDVEEIDRYLLANPASLPYHHMQWLESIKLAYGHDYLYLVARESGQIQGVLPICIFRGFYGKKSFCSLPYCDVGGVVSNNKETSDALVRYSLEKLESANSDSMEIRQRSVDDETPESMQDRKVSMLLELPDSSDDLMQGFKSKLRSQIRKAERNGLVFESQNDARSVEQFYHVFSQNMRRLGSPVHSLKWFGLLQSQFRENMVIGTIRHRDSVIGAGIMMFSGTNVAIPWASTLRQYNHLAPNMLLYWNLLRIACERGGRIFDFGRSTYQAGTYKFKEQWGARPVPLVWCIFDRAGQPLEMSMVAGGSLRRIVESAWRFFPIALANLLGPYLRKHISL